MSCSISSQMTDIESRESKIMLNEASTRFERGIRVLDKEKIVTCSEENIKIWNIDSGECIKTLLGHTKFVTCTEILSEEKLASASTDKSIRIWSTKSGECLKIFQSETEWAWCLQRLSDRRLLAGQERTIKLFNIKEGECILTLNVSSKVLCIAILSNDKIICGHFDGFISVWNLDSITCISRFQGHTQIVNCIQVLSEEQGISASVDRSIKIWNLKTYDCIKEINAHLDEISAIQVLSSTKVASASHDKTIKVFNLDSGECEVTFDYEYRVNSFRFI